MIEKMTEQVEQELAINFGQIQSRRNLFELLRWIDAEMLGIKNDMKEEKPIAERVAELVDLLSELEWEYASSLMERR